MIVRRVDWDDPAALALRTAQRAEVSARYDERDTEPGPIPTASDVSFFLIVFDDDDVTPIACGGLRRIDESHGEIKRMFVVPERRGSGASTLVIRSLENAAQQEFGWDRLVLETGDRLPEAIRFYQREGYTRIPNFGYYVQSASSLCFERVLTPLPR